MITLKNVSFAYNRSAEKNLTNIQLEINKGEAVALIGLSGCGKTTLTRMINALAYKFYGGTVDGEITVAGIDPRKKELYEVGRKVGSIFQNPKSQFFAEIVEDEIAFGLENYGVERTHILERTEQALRSINGENLAGKNLFQLSSGERQKVAIASINALDPPIYVFDEPSANLDMKSVEALKKLMLSLKEAGKTIVISEHRIYYLKDIADYYYYMEDGKIIQRYTRAELLQKPPAYFEAAGLRTYLLNSVKPKAVQFEGKHHLDITALSFSYKGATILTNVNYVFTSGNIYGIIGSNGVGKSTLSKILCGLLKEKSGTIAYNGKKLGKSDRRKSIYYLSNNPDSNLFEVSPAEELKLNDPAADVKTILRQFHLENTQTTHPHILSGGQKQQLTIAAAELLQRDVYIFDEPTSGLDGKNMRLIAERMKLLQERQKIVIIISHDYEFLMEACNKILYLDGHSLKEFSAVHDKEKILEVLQSGEEFS